MLRTKSPLILSAIMASLLASGCANLTQDADGSMNKTSVYGGLGALAGAAVGALANKDNRGKGALIGAAVGGTAGAGYGYYADKQEEQLRQVTQGTGIEVQRQGDEINLVMPSGITFATGSAQINSSIYPTLDNLANSFAQFPQSSLVITGHTDSVGSDASNQALSLARARSVASYLNSHGVASNRTQTVGAGESQPIASNDTDYGRAENRRVEIRVVEKTQQAEQTYQPRAYQMKPAPLPPCPAGQAGCYD